MKGLDILKKAASVALAVAGFADPRLAPLAKAIGAAIDAAESAPGKKGAEKALIAQQIVAQSLPDAIAAYEQFFGRSVVDEKLLAEALKDQQEATVKIMNAFGMLPK